MPKMVIVYGSGMGRTKTMAEAIADGARTVEGAEVVLMDAYDFKPEDAKGADAMLLGGSTYNYKLIKSMDPVLKAMEGMSLKNKVGVAFGSHGWSGEGVVTLVAKMKSLGMKVIEPPTTAIQVPKKEDIQKCFHLGRTVAQGLMN
jgi:flavorubredoxin